MRMLDYKPKEPFLGQEILDLHQKYHFLIWSIPEKTRDDADISQKYYVKNGHLALIIKHH
jgi:hypothetical protein